MTEVDHSQLLRLLGTLVPLHELQHESLQALAAKVRFAEIPPNSVLMAANEHRWLTYLIDGEALIRSDSQEAERVLAGSERACQPLFRGFSSDLRVVARSKVRLLRVEREMLKMLHSRQAADATEVMETELNTEEDAIFVEIYEAYNANRLRIPSLPDIAIKIRDAVNNPDMGVADTAAIIQNDPALSGRLIQVANSPLYRGVGPVNRLRDAVARLGLNVTQNLAFGLAVKQLFKLNSILLRKRVQILYDHSAHVSALAFVLARHYPLGLDPETALLGGLIHDIGVIPILNYADNKPHISRNGQQLEEAIVKLRGLIGVMVLTRWGFDHELVDLVEQAEDWYRDDDGAVSYADLVIAAQLYYYSLRPNPLSLPKFEDVPLYEKLRRSSREATPPVDVLGEAQQEIEQVRQLLDAPAGT